MAVSASRRDGLFRSGGRHLRTYGRRRCVARRLGMLCMCWDELHHSRGADASESCETSVPPESRGRREGRVSATPAAPVHNKSTGKEPQVRTEQSGLPCAMALRLITRSPWGPGFLAPIAARSLCFARLGLSVGRPGPHGFVVREVAARPATSSRPPLLRSNVRDDRETPLVRAGMAGSEPEISVKQKQNIFPRRTGQQGEL
jgi:hypothetical protein